MKYLEIYLESLTLQSLCEQESLPYEMCIKAGITKKLIIESMLKKQKPYMK